MTKRLHLLDAGLGDGDELSATDCEGQALLGLHKGGEESLPLAAELVPTEALEAVVAGEVEAKPGVSDDDVEGEDEFGDPCCDLWYFLTR